METPAKLRKKSFTIVEQACHQVRGFRNLYEELDDKVRLSGQSSSTLSNYARKLAQLSLQFGKLPQHISEKELNKYLASLARQSKTPSLSDFKFAVYGLRYCYRLLGMNDKVVHLPKIKHDSKLPVVLNQAECKALFNAPELLKHRILLSLMYSAGLRAREASRLKISDIDSGRMMIHIRQSKYNKDRYVPLSPLILKGLRKYFYACRPVEYLFNGNEPGTPLSVRGMQWALREAVKKCKLQKGITLHTLRHSYATHLLEYGMDIVTIKELLGHERIETTLVYLHVAKPNHSNLFSPFDRLYQKS
ncbi:MAG: integrase [Porphyromonadaceae bacterium]|nr:MAG: integrase [Porphyromonadaceae bacterium]